jgi:sulfite exporter TauE/SafE
MCGPLACALKVRPAGYHLSRIVSYAVAGAIAAFIGRTVLSYFTTDIRFFLPWVMALALIFLGLGLERKIPPPKFISKLLLNVKLGPALGFLSPLLPCGPLYLILGVAIVAGTPLYGAALLAAFAAGTVPVFWFFQASATRLQKRFSPNAILWTQRGLALASAALLIWRAAYPLCCHA